MLSVYLDIETVSDPYLPTDALQIKADRKGEPLCKFIATSPWCCRIVCVGMIACDQHGNEESFALTGDEEEIVKRSRDVLARATRIITFAGKGFDVPALAFAMARHGVKVPEIIKQAKAQKPWETLPHWDLCEEACWNGKTRRPSLQEACIGLLGEDPKAKCTGDAVQHLWEQGRISDIADYCLSDVRYTKLLAAKLQWVG